ncbi:hypothetical protein F5Y04DRAFT_251753 [Hypomontagnella monticulosa]|nr:hypothetical protein F5Y04DRAFT_251753 [Hypomontagnella monticulosa]
MSIDDRGPELAIFVSLFLGLSIVTIALRCYVRARMLNIFQVEDWLAVIATICFVLYCTAVMISIQHGAGKRYNHVDVQEIRKVLQMRWAGEICYIVTSLFLKFTVGVFLLRICSRRWHKVTICSMLAVCLVYHIFYAFMTVFQCQPIAFYWGRYTGSTNGTCWSNDLITGSTYAAAGLNAITDWVLGLLPIALVRNLNLSRRSKILVSCTLALGSIASSATLVRIGYIWQLTQSSDFLYDFTDLAIWSTVENGLGLVASSIATLRPLIRLIFGGAPAEITPPPPRSFLSWRRSGTVAVHYRTRSGTQQYYRMGDFHHHKFPELVRVHDRRFSGVG